MSDSSTREPLLREAEGIQNEGAQHESKSHSVRFDRKSDDEGLECGAARVSKGNIAKAACLVEEAMIGKWTPIEVIESDDYLTSRVAFTLYQYLGKLKTALVFTCLIIPYFEVPMWCHINRENPCGDPQIVPLSGIPYISHHLVYVVDVFCILGFAAFLYLRYLSFGVSMYKMNKVFLYKTILVSFGLLERTYFISSYFRMAPRSPVQFFPYVRVILAVLHSRSLRASFRTVIRVLKAFVPVAILLSFFVLFSSWIAFLLFQSTSQKLIFVDFPKTLMEMFILLTTANNPDVWIPAFTDNRLAFIFFFVYISVGLFLLMNLVLSVIYKNFKMQMAEKVDKYRRSRNESLKVAFSLLDPSNRGWITPAVMSELFSALDDSDLKQQEKTLGSKDLPVVVSTLHSLVRFLRPSVEKRQCLNLRKHGPRIFLALDRRRDFKIWFDEFEWFCDVVGRDILPELSSSSSDSSMYSDYFSPLTLVLRLRSFLEASWFQTAVNCSIFVSLLVVSVESMEGEGRLKTALFLVELTIGGLWILELVMKVIAFGWLDHWRHFWNKFDFFSISLVVMAESYAIYFQSDPAILRVALALRSLRFVTLASPVRSWQALLQSLSSAFPAILPIVGLQVSICSLFSLLGMDLFGGLVFTGNPNLNGTQYLAGGFTVFNYNDFGLAMATSFNLCVVNNWFIIMDGYAAATRSDYSRVFFIVFYVIAVVFVLNLVVASVLDSLLNEIEVHGKGGRASLPKNTLASTSLPHLLAADSAQSVQQRLPRVSSSLGIEGGHFRGNTLKHIGTMQLLRELSSPNIDIDALQSSLRLSESEEELW